MQKRRLLVLYGSQTGYAFETAERIVREGRRHHMQVELCCMEDYPRHLLPTERLIAFVCSVTGQGDPPDNMKVNVINLEILEVPFAQGYSY